MFAFAYDHDTQGAMQSKLVCLWFHWIWKSLDLDHSDPKHTVKTIPTDTHTPSHSALLDLLFSIPSSDFHCNSMIPIIPPPKAQRRGTGWKVMLQRNQFAMRGQRLTVMLGCECHIFKWLRPIRDTAFQRGWVRGVIKSKLRASWMKPWRIQILYRIRMIRS